MAFLVAFFFLGAVFFFVAFLAGAFLTLYNRRERIEHEYWVRSAEKAFHTEIHGGEGTYVFFLGAVFFFVALGFLAGAFFVLQMTREERA